MLPRGRVGHLGMLDHGAVTGSKKITLAAEGLEVCHTRLDRIESGRREEVKQRKKKVKKDVGMQPAMGSA